MQRYRQSGYLWAAVILLVLFNGLLVVEPRVTRFLVNPQYMWRSTVWAWDNTVGVLSNYLFHPCYSSAEEMAALREQLRMTSGLLAAYNITYWLDYGALLGWWKHGDLLPWDHDIDLNVYYADQSLVRELLRWVYSPMWDGKYRHLDENRPVDVFFWSTCNHDPEQLCRRFFDFDFSLHETFPKRLALLTHDNITLEHIPVVIPQLYDELLHLRYNFPEKNMPRRFSCSWQYDGLKHV